MDKKRLIDANKLHHEMEVASQDSGFYRPIYEGFLRCIERSPTVDAVEVVLCKDCKHWKPGDSMMGNSIDDMQRVGGCENVRFRRLENDFCSFGERKTK